MAGLALKVVKDYIESQDLTVEQVNESLLRIGIGFEGGSVQIFLDFDDDDSHVHLEGINFINIPENKFDIMYKVVNDCNKTYKHVKFVLDVEHKQIQVSDDAIIQLDTCGPECFELMVRMLQIVEDAYPTLMKAVWA